MLKRIVIAILLLTALPVCGQDLGQKRLLIINSYHEGYVWSDVITSTIMDYFRKNAPHVAIQVAYMDTKRNNTETFKLQAGLKMKQHIEAWKPDVIIGTDDNAAKYVIQPYFLNGTIPFVFCGLNDDPQSCGFNGAPVTGIREIDLSNKVYGHLTQYTQGRRVGYMAADKDVQRTIAEVNEKQLGRKFDVAYFVKDFAEWKECYLRIQDEADILLMQDVCIVPGWDDAEAIRFVHEHTRIPSGTTTTLQQKHALLTISKSSEEHGLWAADAALRILNGTSPRDIPIEINKKGSLCLNLILAEKLSIVFSPSLLRAAETLIDAK